MGATVKRTKTWKEKLPPGKSYPIDDALKLVKEFATAKFNESVDVSVNLGVDATKSDQQVRGSTVMPHGTGKTVRVAVFTQGKNADAAKAAGADIVQLDEPYLQARAEKAEKFAVKAINRALEGIGGTTALHTCFGYAHIVHSRPNGYPFLEQLADVNVRQISMESAQQKVDLSVLRSLSSKTVIVGVIDLADDSLVEDVDTIAKRIRNALKYVDPERLILAPDCGMKYLPRAKAFGKLTALARAAAKVRAELE